MNYAVWQERWNASLRACEKLGGEAFPLVILPPASADSIAAVEQEMGLALPTSFRTVLTEFSAGVDVRWFLPENVRPPVPLRAIFAGSVSWSLAGLFEAEENRKSWLSVFTNLSDPYDRIWHDKLAFCEVPNGDCIAFDLSLMLDPPVVYLSHEDGEGHGYWLGENFIDYVERLSNLGCVGNENWQMMPFLANPTSGLNPNGEKARQWRKWFGLSI